VFLIKYKFELQLLLSSFSLLIPADIHYLASSYTSLRVTQLCLFHLFIAKVRDAFRDSDAWIYVWLHCLFSVVKP